MHQQWQERVAQERRHALRLEAEHDQLLRQAGIRGRAPDGLQLAGLVLVSLPVAIVLARAWLKI